MTKPWLPSSDGWLPITDWVALFYEIGWLCHLRIFKLCIKCENNIAGVMAKDKIRIGEGSR